MFWHSMGTQVLTSGALNLGCVMCNNFNDRLMNKHVSMKLRLNLFDPMVTLIFSSHGNNAIATIKTRSVTRTTMPRTRMWRSVVGWVPIESEQWRITMSSMRAWISAVLIRHPVAKWPQQFAIKQHVFAARTATPSGWFRSVLSCFPQNNWAKNIIAQQ